MKTQSDLVVVTIEYNTFLVVVVETRVFETREIDKALLAWRRACSSDSLRSDAGCYVPGVKSAYS